MHSVRLEPTKLILIGPRATCQATADVGLDRKKYDACYKKCNNKGRGCKMRLQLWKVFRDEGRARPTCQC